MFVYKFLTASISPSLFKKSSKKKSQLKCLNYCQHTSDCVDKRLRNLSWFVSFFTVIRLTGFLIVSSFLISSVSTMSMSAGSLFTDKKKTTTSSGTATPTDTVLSFQGTNRRSNRATKVKKLKARFQKTRKSKLLIRLTLEMSALFVCLFIFKVVI